MKIPAMFLKAFIWCLLLLQPVLTMAQFAAKVDGEQIKQIISIIASDQYEGRETGTSGCTMAEDYFAAEFARLKLLPAGDNGTYFHHYTITNDEYDEKPALVVDDRSFYYGYDEDFQVTYKSDRGAAEAEIVFAGYGIYNPEKGRNDYDSIDVRNKIVLIRRGAPQDNMSAWIPSCIDSVKAAYCFKQGALGILFFEPEMRVNQQVLIPSYGNHLAYVSVLPGFPVFTVDERVARFILANSGKSYYRLMYQLDNQTLSFSTGRKCSMSAKPSRQPVIQARNVMAIIPGSDRNLKNEYILIGGHLDHIGMDDAGNIRNGADDNASGPAVSLGIAQAMVKNKFRPKRSIVFVAWTGEEMGLLGSKAWCERPTIDLSNIVVYFNLDMVGLGNGGLNMPGTEFAPEVYEFLKSSYDSASLSKINWSKGGLGGSDHNYFLRQGVPAFAGMTSGSHPDYHQPGDDPDKIKAEILQFTGDFIYNSTEKIANAGVSFLSAARMTENKVKLVNYNIYRPVYAKNFRTDLKDSNHRVGMVDFSDMASAGDTQVSFFNLLGALDKELSGKRPGDNLSLVATAYEVRINRSALLAAFNPDIIAGDELKFKILARYGFRLARITNDASLLQDTSMLSGLLSLSAANGVGLILEDLDIPSLTTILTRTAEPVIILHQDASLMPETLTQLIKNKQCLLVFQPVTGRTSASNLQNFKDLLAKIGKQHITITPADNTETGMRAFKDFLVAFLAAYPDEDFQYDIFTGSFYHLAAKSLQVTE